jgi:peptidoglycan hydrolase-like protein with peptidoglycan-binding domain
MRRTALFLVSLAILLMPLGALAEGGFSDDPDRIETAAKSVLMLDVYDEDGEYVASGSGFVAFDNKTLVTNDHVIEDADYIMAYSDDGYRYIVDTVLIADETRDVAILGFFSPTDLAPLSFNANGILKRAQTVVAIGSPIGITNTVSIGNISALYEEEGVSEVQFTAPISPGSSGGALFDDSGEVIGITSAIYLDAQNINIAVHASEVLALYAEWDGSYLSFSGESLSTPAPTITPKPTPIPTATPKPTPRPTPTPRSTPTPETYEELEYGDRGEDVKKLQLALIALGYLDGTADGIFGDDTRQSVYDFNAANGIFPGDPEVASNKTLILLYDGDPVAYEDPAIELFITTETVAEWYSRSGDELQIHFQVANKSKNRTVKTFELCVYATNAKGDQIYDKAYYWTTTLNVKPGETVYSNYITLPDRSQIAQIHCGISKVVYSDGTTESLKDSMIDFWTWIYD